MVFRRGLRQKRRDTSLSVQIYHCELRNTVACSLSLIHQCLLLFRRPSALPQCLFTCLAHLLQKSDTRPLKLQSPPEFSPHLPTGSRFGPPSSPVIGFTSPSNSDLRGLRASGCISSATCASAARGVCLFRKSRSNSRCCSFGRCGGEGRFRLVDMCLPESERVICERAMELLTRWMDGYIVGQE